MKIKKTRILGLILAFIIFFTNLPFGSGIVHAGAGDVEINVTNFPDKIFKGFVKQYDKNNNGILEKWETSGVTNIYLKSTSSKGKITSLEGIACFKDLEILDCSNN